MSRRGKSDRPIHEVEFVPDERPIGALRYADPSTAEFPRHIHTFNEPYSPRSKGANEGIRSMTGGMVPWHDRHNVDEISYMPGKERKSDGLWAAMARKKGTLGESD